MCIYLSVITQNQVNVGIYVLSRTRSLRYFMSNHFTMNTQEAFLRPWTLLTCNFKYPTSLTLLKMDHTLQDSYSHLVPPASSSPYIFLCIFLALLYLQRTSHVVYMLCASLLYDFHVLQPRRAFALGFQHVCLVNSWRTRSQSSIFRFVN